MNILYIAVLMAIFGMSEEEKNRILLEAFPELGENIPHPSPCILRVLFIRE